MSATAKRRPDEPRVLSTIKRDAQIVFADLRKRGVRHTVSRTFADLETFYLSEHRRQRLAGMGPVRRWFHLLAWLLRSLFFSLTPARRVLLIVAFWFLVQGDLTFGGDHARFTVKLGGVGVGILALLLLLELKDKLMAKSELEAGRAVQEALLPSAAPEVAGWEIWMSTRPANDVGGDLVDYVRLDDGHVGLVLADVAGKGLGAALLMARLQATLRALVPTVRSLEELGAGLNTMFRRDAPPNRFATLVYAEVAPASGRLRLLNAGHMPPLLLSQGLVHDLPNGGAALGIVTAARYEEQVVDLAPGDVLVVYSDGLSEAMNEPADLFGEERLRGALGALGGAPPAAIARTLLDQVEQFVGEAPWHDDLSLLVLRRAAH